MNLDKQKARALCEKATPGPWIDSDGNIICPRMEIRDCKAHDLIFIMESRALLPAALDMIDELELITQIEYPNALAEVENLKEQIGTWHLRRESELLQMNDLSRKSNEQAKRIEELEAALLEEKEASWSLAKEIGNLNNLKEKIQRADYGVIETQAKRIADLEMHNARLTDALIEARTKLQAKGLL